MSKSKEPKTTNMPLHNWLEYLDKDTLTCLEKRGTQLAQFADHFNLRPDWHEADEQGITATVIGTDLDNAMGDTSDRNCGEMNVLLQAEGNSNYKAGKHVINLATLLALASLGFRTIRFTATWQGNGK